MCFRNVSNQYRCPYVVYADCETITTKIAEKNGSTALYQNQIPCSVGYKVVCHVEGIPDAPPVIYTGEDCVQRFMQDMLILEKKCLNTLFGDASVLARKDFNSEEYNAATDCMICHQQFNLSPGMNRLPCLDHCTQAYIGAIHERCQAVRQRRFRIPIFFHNFRGYDSHLIIWGLAVKKGAKVQIIGQGMEKYLVLQWGNHIEFKDSYQFLNSSLAAQTQNLLASGKDNFSLLRTIYPNEEQFGLLLRKGVYPYDWVDDWSKMKEKELPPREQFFNILHNEECSQADWNHAHLVWNAIECETVQEYHELYLKSMFS